MFEGTALSDSMLVFNFFLKYCYIPGVAKVLELRYVSLLGIAEL